jgi:hypothetical protein
MFFSQKKISKTPKTRCSLISKEEKEIEKGPEPEVIRKIR